MTPSFYPEGDTPKSSDNERRSLHKVAGLLNAQLGGDGGEIITSAAGAGDKLTMYVNGIDLLPDLSCVLSYGGTYATKPYFFAGGDASIAGYLPATPNRSCLKWEDSTWDFTSYDSNGVPVGRFSSDEDVATPDLVSSWTMGAGTGTPVVTDHPPYRALMALDGDAVADLLLTDAWGDVELSSYTLTKHVPIILGVRRLTWTSGIIACYF